MDPAAEGAADPAVAIEEEDVLRRRHDPSIAWSRSDINPRYPPNESLSSVDRSCRPRPVHDPRSGIGPRAPGLSPDDFRFHPAADRVPLHRQPCRGRTSDPVTLPPGSLQT